ncbi:Uncharacterised protein [Zhongshania aliphaticivorans]|uniref:Uncharacterized protein n=1 Tax=Zhongshania aliphaticivorans TaxID=1470434 RepID=A0A5S9MV74_9GAMM|nr:Uncharacterised protein [Zhongshania aliphaticivorans]CAA0085229.1 Uncharacterised protein [Zhongshania aliphaticivorans]
MKGHWLSDFSSIDKRSVVSLINLNPRQGPYKHAKLAAEKRGGTAKAPHLFVQSLRSFLHKNALHFVCP